MQQETLFFYDMMLYHWVPDVSKEHSPRLHSFKMSETVYPSDTHRIPEEWGPQPHRHENLTYHNTNQSWVNLLFPNRFTKLWKKKRYKHKYQQQLSFLRQRHNQQSCSVTDESLLWLALRFHNSQSRKKLSPVPTQGACVYMCVSVVSFHGSTM